MIKQRTQQPRNWNKRRLLQPTATDAEVIGALEDVDRWESPRVWLYNW